MKFVVGSVSARETVSSEAGCVVETVNNSLEEHDLMLPYDLGSRGSCQIGGNISTCAGGLKLMRYGSLQKNVLGLEAVLANGDILKCMSKLKKDNSGYHLRQLFIGSEGTLGIITKAVIICVPKPSSVNLAFLGLNSFHNVLKTMKLAKKYLGEIMSSCEMMDSASMDIVTSKIGLKSPLSSHNFYMIVESHGANENHDSEKMSAFLEEALMQNIINDGTVTNEPSRMANIWQLREHAGDTYSADLTFYIYDITLPINEHFYDVIHELKKRLQNYNVSTVAGFAHLGDGNMHVVIVGKEYKQEILDRIEPFIFELVAKRRGSISAEHGIGFKKSQFLKYSKSIEAIETMKKIKERFDPNWILNPYKVLTYS